MLRVYNQGGSIGIVLNPNYGTRNLLRPWGPSHLQSLLADLELRQHTLQALLAALEVASIDNVGDVGGVAHEVLWCAREAMLILYDDE